MFCPPAVGELHIDLVAFRDPVHLLVLDAHDLPDPGQLVTCHVQPGAGNRSKTLHCLPG